ncbi:MAG TPA: DUF3048 domain-containing protein [Candidatus Flavonifractor merdigallinarum]|uniref:DUF3048 domain-containing protein n=1 Tax=Candidatus Flavonifractor merdigallinarum TaxID=2838589 RepID=A0A9D2BZN4_9FIRM|nr:DUF3048 domain-containing protein [Candidatus Flavonifractor merdigallinarum]
MRKPLLPLCLALTFTLTACGGQPSAQSPQPEHTVPAPAATPTAEPTPTPYNGPRNPLTGEPLDEAYVNRRPVAVMLNNLKVALPQLGVAQADIIYECIVEGGITRMMGVWQDPSETEGIGSIRSARPYYLELALGHDAIYIHAGGSEDAYSKISSWGVTALDGVRGTYCGSSPGSNLMWRDSQRRKTMGYEHSVVTTGSNIAEKLEGYSFRLDHKDGYTYEMEFADDATPADGVTANTVTVPFSNVKTGVFTYNSESGKYAVEEYGQPYVDGNTGEQVEVTNVLVLKTACRYTGDSLGHITVDLTSGGEGYFACGGKMTEIRWSKGGRNDQLVYTTADGAPLTLGRGSSYVNIVPLDADITAQ